MPVDIKALIKYRINRAEETLEEASLAIENSRLHLAVNRIYYAAFYVVSALALSKGFKTSKHSQLLSWFNQKFVKKELIDKNMGKFYLDAFGMRQEGDYDDLVSFDLKYVGDKLTLAKDFVRSIKEIIKS
jgi:uncharacterized protein (UPF0332 family)